MKQRVTPGARWSHLVNKTVTIKTLLSFFFSLLKSQINNGWPWVKWCSLFTFLKGHWGLVEAFSHRRGHIPVGLFNCELWSPELIRVRLLMVWPQVFHSLPALLTVHDALCRCCSYKSHKLFSDHAEWLLGYFVALTWFLTKELSHLGRCEAHIWRQRSSSSLQVLLIFHWLWMQTRVLQLATC